MKVAVLLFARYREAAGMERVEVEVPSEATLAQVWDAVRAAVPDLRGETRPLLACDQSYARPERVLRGGEEIAAFPPVSGG
ncbi:MAG TPA: MoaD/ThiS family protein [Candidatus Polarisedimenticolia bacterium]|nr:MoaD/ThiS family protein [Candidatus Polarisedimenticolia bacterium]